MNSRAPGRHFLQIPGPTDVPGPRVARDLRADDRPSRPGFRRPRRDLCCPGLKRVFRTSGPVVAYPASGTGAWEAALVNTLSPGDAVLMVRTGWFATLWSDMATRLGLEPIILETDWRRGADAAAIEAALREDAARRIRAVCVVHNETSTGASVRSPRSARRSTRRAIPPCCSSTRSPRSPRSTIAHDDWGVDVTVAGSPEGADAAARPVVQRVSARRSKPRGGASCRAATGTGGRCWRPTPASISPTRRRPTCCAACRRRSRCSRRKAWRMCLRATTGTPPRPARRCGAWGQAGAVELQCQEPRDYSSSLTAVRLARGLQRRRAARADPAAVQHEPRQRARHLKDRVFRIGHLGDFNDLSLLGALGGVEMGLKLAGIPCGGGGVDAAMSVLAAAGEAQG